MNEVLTILGPTPDSEVNQQTYPGAVREWCINSAVVDPATDSILAGSEDGKLYRWNLTSNSFTQVLTLTTGIGEAYTPTLIGPDGLVYAINNATLFAIGDTTSASLVKTDTVSQGNWLGVYGSQGYDVIGKPASIPSYATVTPAGQTTFTWAATTTDPRALQTPDGTNRIAATWYSSTSFTIARESQRRQSAQHRAVRTRLGQAKGAASRSRSRAQPAARFWIRRPSRHSQAGSISSGRSAGT